MKLESFAEGRWIAGAGDGSVLLSAVNGQPVASISSTGLDFAGMVRYAKTVGGPGLRAMTFHQRAALLKALAKGLLENKKAFYELSTSTGATRADSWIDIDGGISTLFVYSSKGRRELPDDYVLTDGPAEIVSRNGTFVGQHIFLPLRGVAVQINAYNFPCWGMLEKLAPALLAGVPTIVKPASSTAYLTECVVRSMIDLDILPAGALQLVCGGTGNLLAQLDCQDIVAFTGSKTTADKLRQHPNIIGQSVRFTAETDSLNCAILGPDAVAGTPEFDLYLDEIVKEMTSKAGQKCTAIRRIIAPRATSAELVSALAQRLSRVRVGNPASTEIDMGALASLAQREEVRSRIAELAVDGEIVYGDTEQFDVIDADAERGAFFAPVLLHCQQPMTARAAHRVEAFGPVATVLPYDDLDQAATLARMGEGSLAASNYTYDNQVARSLVLEIAPYHGRLVLLNRDCAAESTGHGSPLPHLVHGGPGRAGGGEELGGIRGVLHYMQRTALQGTPATLTAATNLWIRGAGEQTAAVHPFRKTFEELAIGDTLHTGTREITLADIERFAELSGDYFYAHMNETEAARNPFFDGRVAHGYFLVSAAAGLFVDAPLGPVLANYGLDNLRFVKPVSPGDRIGVRLTVKQKTSRAGLGYGEVRWDVEITNQDGEIVAAYDVLTMVATAEKMRGILDA